MILNGISLQDYRCYSGRIFVFSPELTLIIGPNTAGKTSILEAIYLLATGRSFRAGVDREMIREGQELSRVKCELRSGKRETEAGDLDKLKNKSDSEKSRNQKITLQNAGGANPTSHIPYPTSQLEVVLTIGSVQGRKAQGKKYLINGVGKRKSDFIGNLYAVVFHPQDIELITGSPAGRRVFLDNILCQTSRRYARAVSEYEKALRRRNKVLAGMREKQYKNGNNSTIVYGLDDGETLEYWDKLLVENGKVITEERGKFVEYLNVISRMEKTAIISTNNKFGARFRVEYAKSEISFEQLEEYRVKEIRVGHSLIGPHRDDFIIRRQILDEGKQKIDYSLGYSGLSEYGSRGEQRMGVLWLRLGELGYLEEMTNEKPVLLLDDIFSELDHEHRELVMRIIPDYQTIITTADKHYVEGMVGGKDNKVIREEDVKVIRLKIVGPTLVK